MASTLQAYWERRMNTGNKKKPDSLVLAIDVGNTSTNFGLFDKGSIKKSWAIATPELPKWHPEKKHVNLQVVAASVVPYAEKILKGVFKNIFFVSIKDFKWLKIKLENKYEIGPDRLVNVSSALEYYGSPSIIIDFGTATTFDVISQKNEYLGGAIAPGILLTRDVLHERTAKLPLIKLKPPKDIIGDSTVEAIRSGLIFGYVSMVEGMIIRLKHRMNLRKKIMVIATGGLADLIGKYTDRIDIIDKMLTLKGLNNIWQKNLMS